MKKTVLFLIILVVLNSYGQQIPIGTYSTPIPTPGQYFQGGIIGYVYNSSNATNCASIYDPCKYKGTIMDTGNYQMSWGPIGMSVPGTAGCVGSGQNNTNIILSTIGNNVQSAAKFCDLFVSNGYQDWFLPSNSEIHLNGISGISTINWIWNAAYWSSSFYNGANPFSQWGFSTVQPGGSGVFFMNRSNQNYVKPARYFEINLPYITNDSVVINSGDNVNLTLQAYSQTGVSNFTWVAQTDNPSICGESLLATSSPLISDVLINTTDIVQYVNYNVNAQTQSNNCIGDFKVVKVIILPSLVPFSAGTDTSVCQGGSIALNASGANNYTWDNNILNGVLFVPPSTTIYHVFGDIGNNCFATDSVIVTVIPNQPAFFPSVNPICAGDPLAPLPTSSLNLFQGTWSPPINNMATTTYTFTPNLNVCAWDTTTLTIIVKPIPVLTSQDITTCIGQAVTISSTPDLPNGTFNWSNNTTANQFTLTADTSTFYTATYTLDGCTSLMDTVNVIVNALPLVSITPNGPTTFCAESSVELTSSSNYGNLWSSNENTQNITASVSGTYELMVTDSNGCVDSASIIITNSGVPCLQIGGVFTPNGDGSNDTWQIIGIENYPDATVEIFNRWGQQLFFSKGYSVPWNGTYNNESLPTGDYFYIIDLGINDPIKGALTIKN